MTAKTLLREVALAHFAKDGYEGASLRNIAEEVGIKKPSIYAHYKGKDDLFLSVLQAELKDEQQRIKRYFIKGRSLSLEKRLRGLILYFQAQYAHNSGTKFLLRTAFFPPQALYDEVMNLIYPFLDHVEVQLSKMLQLAVDNEEAKFIISPEQAAAGYMAIIDAVLVEMLYGNDKRAQKRINALWPIYWRGVVQ